ncbi:Uncharacterized protein ChrSV_3775 [Chromobacterium vaccinii]|nr:Uncharacterized protein ChrSW_3775 [Chromobacterium vaccinii]QND91232.1 Uncharacterized protein ChrSV_3775 [Chromobacterium vaccinii]
MHPRSIRQSAALRPRRRWTSAAHCIVEKQKHPFFKFI